MTSYGKELYDFLGPSGSENTLNSRKSLVFHELALRVVGDGGLTFPFTDLSIRDGFEKRKTTIG